MSMTIGTEHVNELVVVDEALDPRGGAVVALGLINQDGSDTFPGRTLTPDQAEELAASLALFAAAARARAGLAPPAVTGEQSHTATLHAIKTAVPLVSAPSADEAQRPEPVHELGDMPIADYDRLSAAAITKRLSGLSTAQLATVLAYEQTHRNRKTVCDRVTALQTAGTRATEP
jgi:hypothetical protein